MPRHGSWIPDDRLRSLVDSGLTYDEIAAINGHSTGWTPDRSTVKRRLDALGIEPRHASHKDLLPWTIRSEHNNDRIRKMLQSESRARQGIALTSVDEANIKVLHDLVYGRGDRPLVVGYSPDIGFYLTVKKPEDDDIIRR